MSFGSRVVTDKTIGVGDANYWYRAFLQQSLQTIREACLSVTATTRKPCENRTHDLTKPALYCATGSLKSKASQHCANERLPGTTRGGIYGFEASCRRSLSSNDIFLTAFRSFFFSSRFRNFHNELLRRRSRRQRLFLFKAFP